MPLFRLFAYHNVIDRVSSGYQISRILALGLD